MGYHRRNLYELNWDRLNDFYRWLKMKHFLMSKDLESEFLFLYSCTAVNVESFDSLLKDLFKINRHFVMQLSYSEFYDVIFFICHVPIKKYNFRNDTIIKKLGITRNQQKHLKMLISDDEALKRIKHDDKMAKQKAVAERKKRRLGLETRNRKIYQWHQQGLTYKKIAHKVGLKPGTIGNVVRKFRNRS